MVDACTLYVLPISIELHESVEKYTARHTTPEGKQLLQFQASCLRARSMCAINEVQVYTGTRKQLF